ncbi:MAG: CHC2 zinc finger domain-containing protein [Pseudomonadota bacterium]
MYPEDHRKIEAQAIPLDEVAGRLAIQGLKPAGHEMVGPCPMCGGTDRFGINARKGKFLCRRCGAKGGAIDLVMFVQGIDFPAALTWLCGPASGITNEERRERIAKAEENKRRNAIKAAKMRADVIRQARNIWEQGIAAEGTAVRDYLTRRGIPQDLLPQLPACFRFHPALPYTEMIAGEWQTVHTGPAMLAAIQGPDGKFSGLHRTWLDLDRPKGKINIAHPVSGAPLDAKKVLGSKKGGAIRLSSWSTDCTMVAGEGIETTLSALVAGRAGQDPDLAQAVYWCLVDLGNMAGRRITGKGQKFAGIPDMTDDEAWVPPSGVSRLIFVKDGDSDAELTDAMLKAGLRRAMSLRPGLRGQIAAAPEGRDLNDVLMGVGG